MKIAARKKFFPKIASTSRNIEQEHRAGTSSRNIEQEHRAGTSSRNIEQEHRAGTSSRNIEQEHRAGTSSRNIEQEHRAGTSSRNITQSAPLQYRHPCTVIIASSNPATSTPSNDIEHRAMTSCNMCNHTTDLLYVAYSASIEAYILHICDIVLFMAYYASNRAGYPPWIDPEQCSSTGYPAG